MRGALSIVLALLLASVLAVGSCLACGPLVQKAAKTRCCGSKCTEGTPEPADAHCASPKVDLAAVEKAPVAGWDAPQVAEFRAPGAAILPGGVGLPRPNRIDPPYTPPDLYLLHSSLTI